MYMKMRKGKREKEKEKAFSALVGRGGDFGPNRVRACGHVDESAQHGPRARHNVGGRGDRIFCILILSREKITFRP
jgi:hypothetical protein